MWSRNAMLRLCWKSPIVSNSDQSASAFPPHNGRWQTFMPLVRQTARKKLDFNPHDFLSTIGKGRKMVSFHRKDMVFGQGDPTDGLFFIQRGKIQLTVLSDTGKEATLGILKEGDFFGESGLAGQVLRMSTATAMTDCTLLHVEKKTMMHAMSVEPKLS